MKTSGIPLSSLPPKVRAQVEAQLGAQALQQQAKAQIIRQSTRKENKTEAAFREYLEASYGKENVLREGVTLRLGNGVTFTPDYFVKPSGGNRPHCYEVKGFMRDDAAVKIKVAAREHDWAQFWLIRRAGKTGGWEMQVVLP